MIEIHKNLFIGNESDYELNVKANPEWFVVHACKEPYHRSLLGYSGRGAPKEHPEYFFAKRKNRLFLNLVDADDPAFIPEIIIHEALKFIDCALIMDKKCLVHCNQGESRSPSIGFLYLAAKSFITTENIDDAINKFVRLYPPFNPKNGMKGFIYSHWASLSNLMIGKTSATI